jgi:hypothetical protein
MESGLASLVILICAWSPCHGCTEETARKIYHGEPEGRLICEARMVSFRELLTEPEMLSTVVARDPVVDQRA